MVFSRNRAETNFYRGFQSRRETSGASSHRTRSSSKTFIQFDSCEYNDNVLVVWDEELYRYTIAQVRNLHNSFDFSQLVTYSNVPMTNIPFPICLAINRTLHTNFSWPKTAIRFSICPFPAPETSHSSTPTSHRTFWPRWLTSIFAWSSAKGHVTACQTARNSFGSPSSRCPR